MSVYWYNVVLPEDLRVRAKRLGAPTYREKFHIICGASSFEEAHQKCEEAGIANAFTACTPYNANVTPLATALAGTGGIFIWVEKGYITLNQLRGLEDKNLLVLGMFRKNLAKAYNLGSYYQETVGNIIIPDGLFPIALVAIKNFLKNNEDWVLGHEITHGASYWYLTTLEDLTEE